MTFELATAGRILVGAGVRDQVADAVISYGGTSVLLITGRGSDRAAPLAAALGARGLTTHLFAVSGEPTVEVARAGVRACQSMRADAVVALGGGSALDVGKAVAALVTNGGDPLDYLEVVGRGRVLAAAPLPFVAVPTTAGTGFGGHPQRRAVGARGAGEGQPAQPPHAAAAGGDRSRSVGREFPLR